MINLIDYHKQHGSSESEKIINAFTKPLHHPYTDIPMEFPMTDFDKGQNVNELLADRRKTHGSFNDHARITQQLKHTMETEETKRAERGQLPLTTTQRESLAMIVHKIGRIIAGDPNVADHWDDIAGYAKIANGVDK